MEDLLSILLIKKLNKTIRWTYGKHFRLWKLRSQSTVRKRTRDANSLDTRVSRLDWQVLMKSGERSNMEFRSAVQTTGPLRLSSGVVWHISIDSCEACDCRRSSAPDADIGLVTRWVEGIPGLLHALSISGTGRPIKRGRVGEETKSGDVDRSFRFRARLVVSAVVLITQGLFALSVEDRRANCMTQSSVGITGRKVRSVDEVREDERLRRPWMRFERGSCKLSSK